MKHRSWTSLVAAALLVGCATTTTQVGASAGDAIAQAEKDLAMASEAGGVWRLIDKSTGGSSKPLNNLLAVAKKKLEAGDEEEAMRIAKRVSEHAKLGIAQAEQQANAMPSYPE